MPRQNLIITTCGTSLLTNRVDGQSAPPATLTKHTNVRSADQLENHDDRQQIAAHIDSRRDMLSHAVTSDARRLSAELNGILGFYSERASSLEKLTKTDQHILLHTDTWLGAEVAALLEQFLQQRGANASTQRVENLNTGSLDSFRHGIGNLIDWAARTLPGYRASNYRVVFNLVGGFKSVQGFMQTIGMFHADDILYIFEGSQELIHIPRLPVNLDDAARQAVKDNLPALRRLATLGPTTAAKLGAHSIPETFLFRLGDDLELSPWGKIIYEQAKPDIYREKLLDPWSAHVGYSESFRKDADDIPPAKVFQLNERIDDLIRHLETGSANLRRLDLKPLAGNPMPPSTHECDAWADADCRRIFLHFQSPDRAKAVLDRLTSPLH